MLRRFNSLQINGGGENVPGITGACATRNSAYLVRGPFHNDITKYVGEPTYFAPNVLLKLH